MTTLIDKLAPVERSLSREKGKFALFAIVSDYGSPMSWDLLVSAPWIDEDKPAAYRLIADRVKSALDRHEVMSLSRIAVVDKNSPVLTAILERIGQAENRVREIEPGKLSDLDISGGWIVTSSADPYVSTIDPLGSKKRR